MGTQKSGTSSLHDILIAHPDVCLPNPKEAHFFDRDDRYYLGTDWWFKTFFPHYKGERVVGSFTPEYLFYEEVPGRIRETFGQDVKIVIILRDPIKRAHSHYQMSVRRGYENLSFEDAVAKEKDRIKRDGFSRNHFSYISRGLYCDQVSRYFQQFGEDNVLTLNFETDILSDMECSIDRILGHIGVPAMKLDVNKRSNQASSPRIKSINRIIYGRSIVKSLFGQVFRSPASKEAVLQFLNRLNSKQNKYVALDEQIEKTIYDEFFSEEVDRLEQVLQANLNHWKR